jgi:hypothetical protein
VSASAIHHLQEVAKREPGVGVRDVNRFATGLRQACQTIAQKHGFPYAGLADYHHRPLAGIEPVKNGLQDGFMAGTRKQQGGIRRIGK